MIIKSKKGMLDDLFDISGLVIALFLCVIFLSSILTFNIDQKEEATLEMMTLANKKALLLNYLSQPVEVNGQTLTMKEAILLAVNTEDGSVAEDNTIGYFTDNELDGRVIIYDKSNFLSKGNNIYWWDQVDGYPDLTENYLHLPNPTNENIPEVTVVMYS